MTSLPLKKILYSILSGLMLSASFPPGKLDWIAWVALVPLLKGLNNETRSNAFRLGLIAGLSHYLTLFYWILVVLGSYGGLHFILSTLVLILLCLYISLYPALFSFLIFHVKEARFRALLTAGIWVSLEFIRARLLTGFPWCLLGYSQFRNLKLIQITDIVGVYGISFLIITSNCLIYLIFFSQSHKDERRFFRLEIVILVLMLFFTTVFGHYRVSGYEVEGRGKKHMNTAIIQGNVDQSIKWDPEYQERTINLYQRLTRSTYSYRPQIIVWPETAVPFFFQDKTKFSERIPMILKESGALLFFGSPAYRRENGVTRYYNRAYVLTPDNLLAVYYDKVHLVPFGEYVPLKRFLPFVHRLVPAAGDFTSGEKISPLKLPLISAGILICFEAIFPELARSQVEKGAEILVNLTNDAWFGMTSAPYQHLSMSVFRAVENRRPLIRAANTGISAFIDPTGRIINRSGLFREDVLTHKVKIDEPQLTFYTRYGDIFLFIILILSLINILYDLRSNRFGDSARFK